MARRRHWNLKISTWGGESVHWYGRLWAADEDEVHDSVDLEYQMNAEQAAWFTHRDSFYGSYKEGYLSTRFFTVEEVLTAGVREFMDRSEVGDVLLLKWSRP